MTTIIIGRAAECDIVVHDEYASPMHCAITYSRGFWTVQDLGSTNGTRIKRPPFREVRVPLGHTVLLNIGDRIMVGRTEMPPWDRA